MPVAIYPAPSDCLTAKEAIGRWVNTCLGQWLSMGVILALGITGQCPETSWIVIWGSGDGVVGI